VPRLRSARIALVTCLLTCAASWPATPPGEYQVKAVFLYNFGQFVDWPAHVFDTPQAPFVICIAGKDPFGKTLDDVVRGESIGGHSLVVRRLQDARGAEECRILFVGQGQAKLLADSLDAVRGHNVLTVTEIDGAERQGAIIVLFSENNRIRMRINLAAARASDLVISSKLLRPAVLVGQEGA
jgi:hypothetical protein